MTCKIVKKLAAAMAAVAVAAGLLAGCVEKPDEGDPNDPNSPNYNGGGLVGDWQWVEERYQQEDGKWEVMTIPDDAKLFFSFTSSGDAVFTEFGKVSDFWIEERDTRLKNIVKGDSVCFSVDYCNKYNISGNTLTIGSSSSQLKCVRGNIANTRSSLGKVYSQDPALDHTTWTRPSESEDEMDSEITFGWMGGGFHDYNGVYISGSRMEYDSWYTENGNRLTVLLTDDDNVLVETVKLDYQLSNGNKTLKLRLAGSAEWDEWTPYVYENGSYKSRAKSNSEQVKRAVSPFQFFRR